MKLNKNHVDYSDFCAEGSGSLPPPIAKQQYCTIVKVVVDGGWAIMLASLGPFLQNSKMCQVPLNRWAIVSSIELNSTLSNTYCQ